MSISKKIQRIKENIPANVTLVAVSKTKPISIIQEAYQAGQRIFGENKIQEMVQKHEALPKDIQWHMIGHIQRNKVKYMASFVSLVHAVDSLKLLKEINKQAKKNNRIIKCLLQIKIASEENKFGMTKEDAEDIINTEDFKNFQHIKIVGLMGMATFTNNQEQLNIEFNQLKNSFHHLQNIKTSNFQLKILSMGMSNDYPIAIKNGSTMIRVGSSIFGKRSYNIKDTGN